ncbi:MAG TPA: GNAT family N-acetyltransferase [Dehalococcoidia bacterium]|jgi:phosphinothricin acetyltransferase|nr:GNAT family N-acetyltransferase [Dehalococcoidia bacterium]
MGELTVREATEEDVPAILDIYNDAILNTIATFDIEPQTLEEKLAWFRDTHHPYAALVAECDGEVIGWASLRRFRQKAAYRYAAENSVYVRKDRHGEGIGGALMRELVQAGVANGFHTIIAGIAGDNPASVRLHKRLGFEVVGTEREVGYKFERWIDVTWMQKMLR